MNLTKDYFKASNMTFRYGLTPIQLSVYCYLVSCAGSADYCFPSVKTIALYCNCSESSARKAVRRLDELGLIRCEAQTARTVTARWSRRATATTSCRRPGTSTTASPSMRNCRDAGLGLFTRTKEKAG